MIRVALISEHASPLAWLGGTDSGGQNVYVGQVARHLAARGHQVDVFTRRDRPDLPDQIELSAGLRLIHVPAGPVTTEEASEQPDGEMFIADITEVVITGLNAEATKLVVESWTPERGLRRVERD